MGPPPPGRSLFFSSLHFFLFRFPGVLSEPQFSYYFHFPLAKNMTLPGRRDSL
jgi:hypothetical protein